LACWAVVVGINLRARRRAERAAEAPSGGAAEH
jgi:hypothetical protein